MKSVIEQIQELMVRLDSLGKDTIATYTQAQEEGIELAPDLLETLGKAYGLAQATLERVQEQRKMND
jgi:hypothetical protein